MKHAYSFLAGVASISLTVFATRSLPGYMFLAGFIVCSLSMILLCRAIGASRLARFFSYLAKRNSIRLSPHWSSGEEKLHPVPYVGSNQAGRLSGSPSTTAAGTKTRPRCNSSAAQNGKCSVYSSEMLSPIHQDVVSALCNLKVPFAEAQQAVLAVAKDGQSFDELFRIALAQVNAGAGKSRRAA